MVVCGEDDFIEVVYCVVGGGDKYVGGIVVYVGDVGVVVDVFVLGSDEVVDVFL